MWNSSFTVIISLLALVVSSRVEVQPSRLDLICFKTTYRGSILDATAKEACTLKNEEEDSPPDCPSCLTRIPFYTGNDFPTDEPGYLLKYPLAKINFSQKGEYYVIVLWNRDDRICQAVGAVFRVNEAVTQKCNKIKYLGWGDFFVTDDYAVSDGGRQDRLLEHGLYDA